MVLSAALVLTVCAALLAVESASLPPKKCITMKRSVYDGFKTKPRLCKAEDPRVQKLKAEHVKASATLAGLEKQLATLKKGLSEQREQAKQLKDSEQFMTMPPNMIHNSFGMKGSVQQICYHSKGCKLEFHEVHPFTQAFEGPYCDKECKSVTGKSTDPNKASPDHPYVFGTWYMGPRSGRGGLSTGWGTSGWGKILRVTGKRVDSGNTYSMIGLQFTKTRTTQNGAVLFRAFMKIIKGGAALQTDVGAKAKWTAKHSSDAKATQGWLAVDDVFKGSRISDMMYTYAMILWCFGKETDFFGDFEMYLALPYMATVFNNAKDSPSFLPFLPAIGDA